MRIEIEYPLGYASSGDPLFRETADNVYNWSTEDVDASVANTVRMGLGQLPRIYPLDITPTSGNSPLIIYSAEIPVRNRIILPI